jgi:hypothetical protein
MGAGRLLSVFLATAIGLSAAPLQGSAFADTPQASCKPELRAEGRRSDPGSAEEKASEALKLSIAKWRQSAQELYGSEFSNWEFAKRRKYGCGFVGGAFAGRSDARADAPNNPITATLVR